MQSMKIKVAGASFVDLFCYLCLSCFLVCSLQHCGHLLGGALVIDVYLCFVTFPCGVLGQV